MPKVNFSVKEMIEDHLWPEVAPSSSAKRKGLFALRVAYASIADLMAGQLSLRAMSLVYTTLLSIVPLLALSFSVLKALGVHNDIEPFLFQFLAPLGEQGISIGQNIIGFIDNIKVGVLGSVGLALLVYTVLSLVQKIENAFNMIWHVEVTRSFGERFSSYLSVILIGPVLIVSALGLTATLMNSSVIEFIMTIEPFGSLIISTTKLLPYFMVIGVFAFVYMFVPNTRVNLGAALAGAIVSGVLWETSGMLFATFVVNSTKYTAIYSSFAVVIMLLIWLYISWLILLFGSNLAFYVQNPSSIRVSRQGFEISNRVKERLALLLMQLIAQRHYQGGPAPSLDELTEQASVPHTVARYVLSKLVDKRLLIESNGSPVGYLPAKALDALPLHAILQAIRSAEEARYLSAKAVALSAQTSEVISQLDASAEQALAGKTLRELVVDDKPA